MIRVINALFLTNKPYWKKTKNKYKHGIMNGKRQYWTRYMTLNNRRCLFRNKGNLIYNYKIKKCEYMSETPMWYDYKCLQNIRKDSLKNVLK